MSPCGKARWGGLEGAANEGATRSVARKRFNRLHSRRPLSRPYSRRLISWTLALERIPIRRLRRVINTSTLITIPIKWASCLPEFQVTHINIHPPIRTGHGRPTPVTETRFFISNSDHHQIDRKSIFLPNI